MRENRFTQLLEFGPRDGYRMLAEYEGQVLLNGSMDCRKLVRSIAAPWRVTGATSNQALVVDCVRGRGKPAAGALFYQDVPALGVKAEAYAVRHNLPMLVFDWPKGSECDAALEQQPDDADIHHNKGNVFVQQALQATPPDEKLLSQAVAEFEQALEISPGLAQAHFSLGAVYFIQDQKQQALAEFEQFLDLDDGSDPAATSAAQNYLQQVQQ